MTEHTRINLDEMTESRAPIDANWSPRKRAIVGSAAALIAVTTVGAGVWWTVSSRPPKLPRTIDEAITVLASSKYEQLDEERQREYSAEAGRLMRELSPEERRALLQDEANREALRKVRENMFDEMLRRFARGEQMERGPWRRRDRTADAEGGRPAFNPENVSPEDREQFRRQMQERMQERLMTAAQSGNAQSAGLRGEMMKQFAKSRASGEGGGGRRGGGGQRGG